MRKKLLLLAVVLASAIVYPGFGLVDEPPYCGNWNLLVAYDDEMASTSFWFYAPFPGGIFPVSVQDYIKIQLERATYRFEKEFIDIQFYVVKYVQWESDDNLETNEEILWDAMGKLGFTSGMAVEGQIVRGLIAWTNQETRDYLTPDGWKSYGGGALPNSSALIVQHQKPWADDNVLQHELSHLFGAALDDHLTENNCVMDKNREHVDYYWEDLRPVEDGYQLLYLGVYETIPSGYIHDQWCSTCKEVIQLHINFSEHEYVGDPGLTEGLPPPSPMGILKAILISISPLAGLLSGWALAKVIKCIRKRKEGGKV